MLEVRHSHSQWSSTCLMYVTHTHTLITVVLCMLEVRHSHSQWSSTCLMYVTHRHTLITVVLCMLEVRHSHSQWSSTCLMYVTHTHTLITVVLCMLEVRHSHSQWSSACLMYVTHTHTLITVVLCMLDVRHSHTYHYCVTAESGMGVSVHGRNDWFGGYSHRTLPVLGETHSHSHDVRRDWWISDRLHRVAVCGIHLRGRLARVH